MIEVHDLTTFADLYTPRRVMKYVLLWCAAGEMSLVVDEHAFALRANTVITITSGQFHYRRGAGEATGYAVEFTYDFFCKDDQDIELIFHNGLFCHFDRNEVIPLLTPHTPARLLHQMREELRQRPYQYLISLHALVQLLLVEINRAKRARGDEIWKPEALYLKFLEMVRANFHHNYPLSLLAERLHTTELKLNELSKVFTGKTAQLVLAGLVVSEAKRLLRYERATIKEVAFQLGFNDPFYFSTFFKKHTGASPKAYRAQQLA